MTLYQNNTPLDSRKYQVSVKQRSGNIYLVNTEDLNDFFMFAGNPDHLDKKRIYSYNELDINGCLAKIKSESFSKHKTSTQNIERNQKY